MNSELKKYIEDNIFPKYFNNDDSLGIDRINLVIERILRLIEENNLDVDNNMAYVIAAYHDIGLTIDQKTHEKIAAEILLKDETLHQFFSDFQLKTMAEAIEDYRAKREEEPRNIYGKLISSASRNNTVNQCLRRSYTFGKKLDPNASDEELYNRAFDVLTKKFGVNGYAKYYFKDSEYEKFLSEIRELLKNRETFCKRQAEYIAILKKNGEIKPTDEEIKRLQEQIDSFDPFNKQEEIDKKTFLKAFDTFDDILTRNNVFCHFSSSAFVVDEEFKKALLVHHNIFGAFIYPGGHVDGETDLLKVAQREVLEETGLLASPLTKDIFAIQALPTSGHVKNGRYISSHTHFDVLYLLVVRAEDMNKIRTLESENSKVAWFDLNDSYNDQVVLWGQPIIEKIVNKIRRLEIKNDR